MARRIYGIAKDIVRKNAKLVFKQQIGIREFVKNAYDDIDINRRIHKHSINLNDMHRRVLDTPRFSCRPSAGVELHTLTSHRHVCMYMTAIKSLLRFYRDIAIVTHDDGTLTNTDKVRLRDHIEGIRIIEKNVADDEMTRQLADFPHCKMLRDRIVNAMELFDNILLANTDRIIMMNSDVLFFEAPKVLIDWIEGDGSTIEGVCEMEPANQAAFLRANHSRFVPNVTTALTCFYKHIHDLPFVENVLSHTRPDWFTAQNMFPLLYEKVQGTHETRFFDEHAYQTSGKFPDDPVFRHYWTSSGFFTELQWADSAGIIDTLREKGMAP